MIKGSAINLSAIRNEAFLAELPELYELKDVIQNSKRWHKYDSVFDHTLRAWEKIEEVLENADGKTNSYLDKTIDRYTRRQILFLGILFHDIGKKETIVAENGFNKCPEHEYVGAEKTEHILERFDLSTREKEFVINLVKHHMLLFHIVTSSNQEIDNQIASMQKDHSDIFPELILLSMADILGSQLEDNDPEEFDFRINYLDLHKFA